MVRRVDPFGERPWSGARRTDWKVGCPKSSKWESEGEAWSEDGHRVVFFLKDWELAKVALSCHMALDMLLQEAICLSKKSLSLAVDGL